MKFPRPKKIKQPSQARELDCELQQLAPLQNPSKQRSYIHAVHRQKLSNTYVPLWSNLHIFNLMGKTRHHIFGLIWFLLVCFLSEESANAVSHYHKLRSRVSHIWGNHSDRHIQGAMDKLRPGKTTITIIVSLPSQVSIFGLICISLLLTTLSIFSLYINLHFFYELPLHVHCLFFYWVLLWFKSSLNIIQLHIVAYREVCVFVCMCVHLHFR